jgi:hypothetical protein
MSFPACFCQLLSDVAIVFNLDFQRVGPRALCLSLLIRTNGVALEKGRVLPFV